MLIYFIAVKISGLRYKDKTGRALLVSFADVFWGVTEQSRLASRDVAKETRALFAS